MSCGRLGSCGSFAETAAPRNGSRWTEEHRQQVYELADAGVSQREIALKVCGSVRQRSTVQEWAAVASPLVVYEPVEVVPAAAAAREL
jgi:hypothetical protein